MDSIIGNLALLLFTLAVAAPILGPAFVAICFKRLPTSVRLGLVGASVLTGLYSGIKYQEALKSTGMYRGLRVLALVPFQYAFAAYIVLVLTSLGVVLHSVQQRRRSPRLYLASLVLIAGVIVAVTFGPAFLALPLFEDGSI